MMLKSKPFFAREVTWEKILKTDFQIIVKIYSGKRKSFWAENIESLFLSWVQQKVLYFFPILFQFKPVFASRVAHFYTI